MFIEQVNLWAFPWSFDEGQKHDQSAIIMEGLLEHPATWLNMAKTRCKQLTEMLFLYPNKNVRCIFILYKTILWY